MSALISKVFLKVFSAIGTFFLSPGLVIFLTAPAQAQQPALEKTRILFLLDGSGSMVDPWEKPNQTKMTVAKSILTRLVDSLKQNDKVELALRVYGHRSPNEARNCKDSWLEVPFAANNHNRIIEKLNEIRPRGVTPITYSLEQSAKDFPSSPGHRNIIILITDGIESCGGDPCAASRELQKKGVFLRPFIIGLGMQAERSLDCAGKFINADTPGKFHHILNESIEATFAKTTVSLELLGANNKPDETNVNVTFINSFTGLPVNDLIHYRDKTGKTDTLHVDPLVDYDLIVSTVPPVVQKNINIIHGKHNTIRVPVPQGNLLIQQQGRRDNSMQAIVRFKGTSETIHVQHNNETFRYLAGKYEVETLTLPRRIFSVDILPEKTQSIHLPAPAVVNFNTTTTGYGSLYEIANDGAQQWVCNLNDMKSHFTLTLLPGKYKLVFRAKNAPGSKYTATKIFTANPGQTVMVSVF